MHPRAFAGPRLKKALSMLREEQMQKQFLLPLLVAAVYGCSDNLTQPPSVGEVGSPQGPPAPLYLAVNRAPGTYPNRYIVVVNDNVPDATLVGRQIGQLHGFSVIVAWNKGLR